MITSVTVHYGVADTPLEVKGDYLPLIPGGRFAPNGDPGEPDEGGYVEDYTILVEGQDVTDLLDEAIRTDVVSLAWMAWNRGE
jgi:hypothetical protein